LLDSFTDQRTTKMTRKLWSQMFIYIALVYWYVARGPRATYQ